MFRRLTALVSALVSAVALALPLAALTTVLTAGGAAAAPPAATRMPGDVPSKKTPWVLDGEVSKIVQVGNTMIAGGLFTQVADPMNGTPYARQNLFAFDATTGLVSQTFNPTVDGQVQQLMPGPTPDTVYVAGDFTKINGKGPNHIQLLNVNTGQAVTSFKAPSTNGGIETMELLPNNRLFIGGFFTKIGGVTHGQLGTLNATTGALDPFMDLTVDGHHNNSGSGAQAPIGIRESGVTPAGDRLVVVGNFRTVGGLARDQIVMLDLTGANAVVSPDWYTTRYTPICSPRAFDSYMRDVEMSPDGSFFVVATTGGPNTGTLCDTASRFETYAVGTALQPTWVTNSGGDTLWGVEITRAAVYVGGHNRWMNNPNGSDRAAQGAVPRPGLSALDPQTGIPLRWNPGRNPRGEAAYEIYETDAGLWVVSDTDWIGNRRYQRPRIAFFPYSEGYDTASTASGSLPGNVYVGAPLAASNVLYRVNAGGAAIASTDNGPDWAADNGTTSTVHNTGSTTATWSALTSTSLVNVPASTPLGIWTQERNDPAGGNEMQWTFPVPAGTSTQVRLYFASRSVATRRFNVLIDGVSKLSSYDPNVDPGVNRGTMKSFDITSDGTVNIDFTHTSFGNPEVNAIEIVNTAAASNANLAKVIAFDGTSVTSQGTVSTGSFDWSNVRNAVMVGRTLFYAQTDGMLYKRSFDGTSFGAATAINPYLDPLWSTVETGSGPVGQTYAGVLPTWYSQLSTVTGMFYSAGRIYYTRSGQTSLFWRWFNPDAGIIGGVENTVTGGNIAWASTRGMFLDGSTLYVVNAPNGQLLKIGFSGGAPTGTSSVADTSIDWRGRAVFLASVLPNTAPTAAFTSSCTGVSCTFDASGSSDGDGTVSSYEWSFSDGDEAGGPTPQKDFAASGTYDVTLTVTDDGGLSSSTTKQVTVVKPNVAPTADFTMTCAFLACDLDATASSDPDGTVTDWAWDFGDGAHGSGATTSHAYASPGTYTATLVVTDDQGATDDASTVKVVVGAPAASTVSYVGGATNQGNVSTPNVTTPSTVSAGDRLVMALTLNSSSRVIGDPTGITGWTVLGTTTSGSMQTRLYSKVAVAGDASRRVTVPLDAAAKYTLTVADYSGVRSGALVVADLAETVNRAGHATPLVDAPAGAWVVSYWADKSAATTGFTLPGSVTGRHAVCSTGTGHVCSSWADSAGAVPTGQYGGLVATADTANATATAWSVVLRTVEANQAPTAAFTSTCTSTACDFDASGSTDADGSVTSWAWDFGDGATATGRTPSHTFAGSGTWDVTLTVTDDEGATGSLVRTVQVTRTNTPPTAAFTTTCRYLVCTFDASGSGDTDGFVSSYAWDFGDGSVDVTDSATTTHTYAAGGSYTPALTVRDNDLATASATRSVAPVAIRPIALVGSTANQGNVSTPNVVVPAGTSAGDRMVLVLSLNDATRVPGDPSSGVTGWTLADTATSGTMKTFVWTRTAAAGDGGRTVRFAMDAAAKYTLTVASYSGDMLAPQVVPSAETVVRAGHTAPTVQAGAGDWAVSYWADKSSATTGFTLPGGVTARQAICGANAGRVCSVLADSGGPLAEGPYGPLTATADSASASATAWTILLRLDR
ncbi:PKD domain-containing protein [Nocardioides sp. J2M5]|uniref:PKD domain-containing protein n=1 Tax=Nocardioides palaemonis TaxID=2829810 RepID=UPI001BAA625E|nr:PKD domain-containing protein [Nocardioides palaemonis]MBS2936688.1 PKD domain-containing protein [Nocardioides palaemonis]